MNLKGKVALVTGGAAGIGEAITRKLAAYGCDVFINYNTSAQAANALIDEVSIMAKVQGSSLRSP